MSTASAQPIKKVQPKRASKLWAIWVLPCLGVAGYAIVRYLATPPSEGHYSQRLPLLQIHAAAGAVALLTGPWQFWTWLRNAHRNWHRGLGRAFLVAVAVSSVAGFILSFHSEEGWATHLGFASLAIAWFCTAWMGYTTVRANRFRVHREWMVRSFALSLAAVMLRNELPVLLFVAHTSFHFAYITVSWICWIPNLIFAEWWIRRKNANIVFRATSPQISLTLDTPPCVEVRHYQE
jgi:hypothetical protein